MSEMQNLGTWEKGFKFISTLACQILHNKATLDSLLYKIVFDWTSPIETSLKFHTQNKWLHGIP